jgi:hypothetical protein
MYFKESMPRRPALTYSEKHILGIEPGITTSRKNFPFTVSVHKALLDIELDFRLEARNTTNAFEFILADHAAPKTGGMQLLIPPPDSVASI